ncbi:CHRD domain-containing protein [Comamonadaceae bacterium OH2545_COT-014]|nr:CHRD domain-containing protein [Comamonadaceae bacterium OH2545_COT-014]
MSEFSSPFKRRRVWLGVVLAGVAWLAGCSGAPQRPAPGVMAPPIRTQPQRQPELAAFRARLDGGQAVPANESPAQGELVAVFNRQSGLLRWKISFSGLSGPVTAAHFHSPAMEGEVARAVLPVGRRLTSPYEGRAVLTPAQRANLLAGQWYVNLRTARYPEGEIRGQLIEQY